MRAKAKALEDVLFGKARGAILALLYEHPDESFYYRQITRQVKGLSVGTLQRELDTLTDLGLVERSDVGKQVFYRANRNHPVFPELRAVVAKTIGAIPMLRSALAPLADRISVAFIYGSKARGDEKAESNIDLLVVGRSTLEEVLGKRTDEAIALLRSKQQPDGTWLLENTHLGKVHVALEDADGRPSRWNTLRALRVLSWYEQSAT